MASLIFMMGNHAENRVRIKKNPRKRHRSESGTHPPCPGQHRLTEYAQAHHSACSAPKADKNVHFWAFFVVEAAGIACRVHLCPAITWGLGSGVVGTNQPSLQGTTTY